MTDTANPDPPTDEAEAPVLDAAALLHVNGQSTGMTMTAVDRLNRGLGTTTTLIPSWSSLVFGRPRAEV